MTAPTSKDLISKYRPGSPSTVLRSLKSLLKNELLYSAFASDGTVYYTIYDILFSAMDRIISIRMRSLAELKASASMINQSGHRNRKS